ncbi:unnamed protein product [Echinostoma caproni]|uniref:SAYSvFN domain-containing protein n=1 Tax=Echinostoma caproni TaxID=27848 RepID=A0A183AAY3_9TREM|nr:unnamed protein product [Echinostoma caproni]
MQSKGRVSFSTLKAKLESYRATLPTSTKLDASTVLTAKVEPIKQVTPRTLTSNEPDPEERPPTAWGRVIHSWRFQGFLTLILWIIAVQLEFGAVCFVLAALYWMWTWGTEKYTRPRDPNEPVIQAAFFFDPSPVPQVHVR